MFCHFDFSLYDYHSVWIEMTLELIKDFVLIFSKWEDS